VEGEYARYFGGWEVLKMRGEARMIADVLQCFKQGDELVVGYAMSPSFG